MFEERNNLEEERLKNLEALIYPKSICLIGASSNKLKIGGIIWNYLRTFPGRKYPVNIKEEEIDGIKSYRSILDINDEVDLAIIAIPAPSVPSVVRECVKKNVKAIIIISSGFSETGEDGRRLEEQIREAIEGKTTRVLGPNTLGVYVPKIGLDTMFVLKEKAKRPKEGPIAYISQSGASAVGFMDMAELHSYGISAFVGLGNKVDVDENDMLEFFYRDESTKVICMHLESFSNGKKFLELCKKITKEKPVILLKAGRTKRGAMAAMLHTGKMATETHAIDGILKQFGIIRAKDLTELFDYSRILAYQKPSLGPNVAIITSGGGYGVIATDYIEDEEVGGELRMAELSDETKERLKEKLPPFASVNNPIDLTGNVTDEMFENAFKIVNEDKNVDAILSFPLLQTPLTTEKLIDITKWWFKNGKKPMVPCIIGGSYSEEAIRKLEEEGIPTFSDIRRAVLALRVLYERGKYLKKKLSLS